LVQTQSGTHCAALVVAFSPRCAMQHQGEDRVLVYDVRTTDQHRLLDHARELEQLVSAQVSPLMQAVEAILPPIQRTMSASEIDNAPSFIPPVSAKCLVATCGAAALVAGIFAGMPRHSAQPSAAAADTSSIIRAQATGEELTTAEDFENKLGADSQHPAYYGSAIVSVMCGEAGMNTGLAFYDTLYNDHNLEIDSGHMTVDGKDMRYFVHDHNLDPVKPWRRGSVFFQEDGRQDPSSFLTGLGRLRPRMVVVDTDHQAWDTLMDSSWGKLSCFNPDSCVFGDGSGCGNNFAKGFYGSEAKDLKGEVLECVRKEFEQGNFRPQGVQLFHSLGGGTGSGLGCQIMEGLQEAYGRSIVLMSHSIWPSPQLSDVVTEPYNAVLAAKHMGELVDFSVAYDNGKMFDIVTKQGEEPNYSSMNNLMTKASSGLTSTLRFKTGSDNFNLFQMLRNLVPKPTLNFLAPSIDSTAKECSIDDLAKNLLKPENCLVKFRQPAIQYTGLFVATGVPSGKFKTSVGSAVQGATKGSIQNAQKILSASVNTPSAVDWSEPAAPIDLGRINRKSGSTPSAVGLGCTSGTHEMFDRVCTKAKQMSRVKAFLSHYVSEGMDADEVGEAIEYLEDLSNSYQA